MYEHQANVVSMYGVGWLRRYTTPIWMYEDLSKIQIFIKTLALFTDSIFNPREVVSHYHDPQL